jgi:uncharacterized protein YutE (UPF0331/DUF86 family)
MNMNNRIKDKIKDVENYLSELDEVKPLTLDEYTKDIKAKAACERYAEKIAEALVDLAFLAIKDKNLKSPESDAEAFTILLDNKIISSDLAGKLQDAKGMRNILAHKYGEIDDAIVFNSISEELERDARDLITAIKKTMGTTH